MVLTLTTTDSDGESISIYTEDDMAICIEHGGPNPKIFLTVHPTEATTQQQQQQASAADTSSSSTTPPDVDADAGGALHPNIVCDACQGSVHGVRFKCAQCTDFDLCQRCERSGRHGDHPGHHVMYRIAQPAHGGDFVAHVDRRLNKWLRRHLSGTAAEAAEQMATTAADAAATAAPAAGHGCRRGHSGHSGRRYDWRQCGAGRSMSDDHFGRYRCTGEAAAATAAATAASATAAAGGCTRARAAAQSQTPPQPPQPTASGSPQSAHLADALTHARTAEKAAAVGFELLAKFSSILDPFSQHHQQQQQASTSATPPAAEPSLMDDSVDDLVASAVGSVASFVSKAAEAAAVAAQKARDARDVAEAAQQRHQQQQQQGQQTAATPEQQQPPQQSTSAAGAAAAVDPEPARAQQMNDTASVSSAESFDSLSDALLTAHKKSAADKINYPHVD